MQRKILNTKYKLHSIPIIKMKSSVLYSISCGCAFAFLLIGIMSLALGNSSCYAVVTGHEPDVDAGTISPVTTPTPTAILSLSNNDMKSDPTSPGSIATTSTDVTVDIKNASSYSLTLSFEKVDLTNGNTTITAGDPNSQDNVWGYTWDGASTYTTPAVSGNTLIPTTNLSSDTTFTKTLAFGAKFANNADPGEYKTKGTLSLAVSPKAAAIITLENITQMQQLAEGYAPDACKNTEIPAGKDYAGPYSLTDVRDNNKYTVYKFKDGKCWMTENLRLYGTSGTYGRDLIPTTTDISENWRLAASNKTGFSDDAANNAYYDSGKNTGYYTWCAATANTCTSATSNGANATSSICPKGWKLPTGGTGTGTDFHNLFKNMGLTISNSLKTGAGEYNSWGTGDLAIVQGSKYNFAYTGYMSYGSLNNATSNGYWWSRTAYSSDDAYALYIVSSVVYPGTNYNNRYLGFAVRCVAADTQEKTFTLTYNPNSTESVTNMPASQSCTTTTDSCSITIPNQTPTGPNRRYFVGWDTSPKEDGCINTAQYKAGSTITLTENTILYVTWGISGCGGSIS